MSKNVLVLGSGGREHALAWKLSQSVKVTKIIVCPGNAGTELLAKSSNKDIPLKKENFPELLELAHKEDIDMVVVAPDDTLADGAVDYFTEAGFKAFGPNAKAAEIESSKVFSKKLMQQAGVPTAKYQVFQNYEESANYLKSENTYPIVVKASGLALGKGVSICYTEKEAMDFLQKVFIDKVFGKAGNEVVIEEFLVGQEISIHAFCDGKSAMLFPTAQDHKAIYENDTGPNTGGMGTISPLPWLGAEALIEISETIVLPILKALAEQDREFKGVLYPGLIMTEDGPKVLEFNARFGDPETQSYMRLLKSDLYDLLEACVDSKLEEHIPEWEDATVASVILASGGYPNSYQKGYEISGLEEVSLMDDIEIFHAGTKLDSSKVLTNGGRVLAVSAKASNLQAALDKAYEAVNKINFQDKYFRRDIGIKSLKELLVEQ